jgi:hypothetical protein
MAFERGIFSDDSGSTVSEPERIAASPSTSSTTQTIDNTFPGIRTSNPLGQYSSYTYQLSLYVVTPRAYDLFIGSGRTVLPTGPGPERAYLIAQSGGINKEETRAPGFDLDYYIDNLEINTSMIAVTRTSSNSTTLKFTIKEPYGFSFLKNLKTTLNVIERYNREELGIRNPSRQIYLLRIKFIGYDSEGNIITNNQPNLSENNNLIQDKFFDINMNSIKFNIDEGVTTYNIDCAIFSQQAAYGTILGTTAGITSIVADTVKDALTGDFGLLTKLNSVQEQQKEANQREYACNYKIEFVGPGADLISGASILDADSLAKLNWRYSTVNSNRESASSPDSTKREIPILDGTPITQAIFEIISRSTYIENSLRVIYNSKTEAEVIVQDKEANTVAWYNLSVQVSNTRWDTIVNNFAVDITYYIRRYETPFVPSIYVNNYLRDFYGPFKRYDYKYTGQNSEIISYSQQLNNLYYSVLYSPTNNTNIQNIGNTNIPLAPGQRTSGNRSRLNAGDEATNNYLNFITDPNALLTARVNILGDPDYLFQPKNFFNTEAFLQFYGSDGVTIDPESGHVYIVIDFKEAVDYDNSDGLMKINDSITFWTYPRELSEIIKGVLYKVISLKSNFSDGKFTQVLECVLEAVDEKIIRELPDSRPNLGQRLAVDPAGRNVVISSEFTDMGFSEVFLLTTPAEGASTNDDSGGSAGGAGDRPLPEETNNQRPTGRGPRFSRR